MDFVQTENGRFIYRDEPIRLRGLGVGTWLCLEHFMMGFPGCEQVMRATVSDVLGPETGEAFFHRYQEAFLQDGDFRLMKECGVNFIRVPFNYRLLVDDNHSGAYLEEGFQLFDRLLSLCAKYEIFAMLDMHAAPGSQNPDWHSDNPTGAPLFWQHQVFRQQAAELWGAIAARYRDHPWLMGYDLLNEPAMAKWDALNEFFTQAIREIRATDKNHVIVLEGDRFSMDFSGLEVFEDQQLAIGFHYYPTVWHPDLLNQDMDDALRREKIAQGLDRIIADAERFGWPLICGEFGYGAADCGGMAFAMQLLEETIQLLEARSLDWVLWCYKDAGFMGLTGPKPDSRWMEMAQAIQPAWTQDIEKEQAGQVLDLLAEKWFPDLTEAERYILQFRLRACLFSLQGKYVLGPLLKEMGPKTALDMTADFAFENCSVQPEMERILKNHLLG